jgi:GGDEF domain.
VADKIIQQVADNSIYYHKHEINITISAGLTEYALHDTQLQQTIKRADQAPLSGQTKR